MRFHSQPTGCWRPAARALCSVIISSGLAIHLVFPSSVQAENPAVEVLKPADPALFRANMDQIFISFTKLQGYLYNRELFLDPAQEKEVAGLLHSLNKRFSTVDHLAGSTTKDPGFTLTLKSLKEMLADAESRFGEGKKSYALWRARTASDHCFSCHSRLQVRTDFIDPATDLSGMNSFERGEFLLATRQFRKARDEFIKAVESPSNPTQRISALQKLLVVHIRISPDPSEAIADLKRLQASTAFTRYEQEEIQNWLESLEQWKNESPVGTKDLLKHAERLITKSLSADRLIRGQRGTIELLRATGMLHQYLEINSPAAQSNRAHALYLLGLAYSSLPNIFIPDLPAMFLEQCIREYPYSEDAKKSFRVYKQVVSLGYTGSAGTELPPEVLQTFKELHDLAYKK